eukprot:7827926-Ditylum_brightwellii.AAC.1
MQAMSQLQQIDQLQREISELSGILVVLYLLHALAEHFNIGMMTQQVIFCDNAATVGQANMPIASGIKSYMATEYDLSPEIISTKAYGIDLTQAG